MFESDLPWVALIVLFAVVVPIWLILHYVTQWKRTKSLSSEDEKLLVDLWQSARKLDDRIVTLETILDTEQPGWRGRHDDGPT